nr:origin recognition complex subunit 5 [Leptinotarsa decemlineata]XP_023024727.1 origin recognition complex subunit 5 [Leptinotarsa decemlineata]
MDQTLPSLQQVMPCRNIQIEQLYNLFAYKDEPYVEAVFVYGGPSTGKSMAVTSLLEKLEIKYAVVNLIECYSSKILFESILNKLSAHKMDPNNPHPYARCDNMMDFISQLQKCSRENSLERSVLVLDKAEELRNMEFNLLAGFLRLRELCGISVSVVFISEIVFEKYYARSNIVEPLKIYFPQYKKNELLEILSMDIENAREMIARYSNEFLDFDLSFYQNYLNAFLSVFYRACRDLSELRHMSRVNFVKYCQPIINKEYTINDNMALWRNISGVLKASLEVLYLRVDPTTDIEDSPKTSLPKDNAAQTLELPFYAKYLLIAAYLASYNSAKDDKRLFMKYHGKKTKKMKDIKLKSKVSERLNTQLGPKPFTFDRLLAIFYSILDENVGFNNNLLVQVSSLVELRLLSCVSDSCFLDGQKYKCNVNFDFIQNISKMVGFQIRKYLSDFSHI